MIQTSRTLIESADGVYSKLTQAQRAGIVAQTHTYSPHIRGLFLLPTFGIKRIPTDTIVYYFEVMQGGLCPKAFDCVHIDEAKI